ncbi:VirB3 family type IV secretion system protein [Desulfovibrio sp. OttesenSCG-928-F07]|nr:VirB3 family type IV secretion system protein [Desulfovibrio sp. OttesenSCG-928-F07]
MSDLAEIQIYRSLHRPNLVFGAEREPVLLAAILPVCLTYIAFSWQMIIVGFVFWFVCSFFCRIMAKYDPNLTKIFMRHINYQRFYPAKTSAFRQNNSKVK